MTMRPWYTPAGLLCRGFRYMITATADPNLIAASAFAYGAIDLLGVRNTVKLILKLRRKNASTNHRTKKGNRQMQ